MDSTTTTARMCDCGNDTVIPGTRLCKDCAWAGQAYPHLFPQDHAQPWTPNDEQLRYIRNREQRIRNVLEMSGFDTLSKMEEHQHFTRRFPNNIRLDDAWYAYHAVPASDATGELDQLVSEWNAAHVDPRDAEIDRLRAEIDRLRAVNAAQSDMLKGAALAAAEVTRERDALRKTLEQVPKYRIGQTVSVSDWSQSIGTIEEISISAGGIEYRVYVAGESMAYTWSENKVAPVEEMNDV